MGERDAHDLAGSCGRKRSLRFRERGSGGADVVKDDHISAPHDPVSLKTAFEIPESLPPVFSDLISSSPGLYERGLREFECVRSIISFEGTGEKEALVPSALADAPTGHWYRRYERPREILEPGSLGYLFDESLIKGSAEHVRERFITARFNFEDRLFRQRIFV